MSGSPRFYRPVLNDSVDVKLQTAFNDGQWSTVARLAAQRYKMKNDPYFETIRICAESQMETVAEKAAVLSTVDALVTDKAAALNIDSIELYEWALLEMGLPYDYAQTIGALRARWAKANPSHPAVLDCLEACVLAWDLVNAQQIAATLDRGQSAKHDGKSMFWNVTLLHLLSTDPQCPENMSTMFGRLARVQLEKAAAAATSETTNGKSTIRGLRAEDEINLYYRVTGKDAFLKSAVDSSSPIGVQKQLEQGRKHLLTESLRVFEGVGDWDSSFQLCEHALTRDDEHGKPSFLAFDMRTWTSFIKAATMKSDIDSALARVTSVLDRFVATDPIPPMYKKNIGLVTLELAFQGPVSFEYSGFTSPTKPSPRVITLYLILEQSLFQRAAFDDVKHHVGQLTFEESKYFIDNFAKILLGKKPNEQRKIAVRVLETKFRYLFTTCLSTLEHVVVVGEGEEPQLKCRFCSTITPRNCHKCLDSVATAALSAYKDIDKTPDAVQGVDKDPRSDLALVAVSALLKLSGLRQQQPSSKLPPLSTVNVAKVLQATALLATQVERTPADIPLRLLLVQVYLLLGCATLAYRTWQPLEVKRTIQDALGPLFFDRLSSISPSLLFDGRRSLTDPLHSYYSSCLREPSPVKIWDAFASGSYTSILSMAEFSDRLHRSGTVVMAVLEGRKASRACGKALSAIDQVPLLSHIDDNTTFVNATDHGSFPSLESTDTTPLYELVKLGPELSSERCRLGLLAERFLDAVTYKAPKEYKPTKPNDVAVRDRAYLAETFGRLLESLSTALLNPPTTITKLTGPEHKFYTTLTLLSALLHTALSTPKSDAPAPSLTTTVADLKQLLATLEAELASTPPAFSALDTGATLHALLHPHTLTYTRETALAIQHSANLLLAFHAAEQARDRTGKSGLHKDLVQHAKELAALAAATLGAAKAHVGLLKEALGLDGWLDRVEGWIFPDGSGDDAKEGDGGLGELVRDVVGAGEVEEWAGSVVESWRDGVKGFGSLVWE